MTKIKMNRETLQMTSKIHNITREYFKNLHYIKLGKPKETDELLNPGKPPKLS